MTTTRTKRDLFGGTLRCAGLAGIAAVASSASADFPAAATPPGYEFLPSQTYATATSQANSPFAYNYTYDAAFPAPVSYVGAGLTMSAYSSASLMGAAINLSDGATWTSATVTTIQWFTVDDLFKDGIFEWDFTSATDAFAYVYHQGYGAVSPIAIEGTAGSYVVEFFSTGGTYAFVSIIEMDGVEGNAFARFRNIPAPSALALLGLGMISTRRRRRE